MRNDFGVYEGSEVTIHYDPMLGKLIVWAADRERALERLGRALSELRIEGIRTNISLFEALLADPDFRSGNLDIGMLDRKLAAGDLEPPHESRDADLPLIAAALAHFARSQRAATPSDPGKAESRRSRWGAVARREAVSGAAWK